MTTVRTRSMIAAAATVPLLLTAACGGGDDTATSSTGSDTATSAPAAPDDSADDDAASSGAYTAGTYEASGSYINPIGTSSVDVELTLDDAGTVTDLTVTPQATGASLEYQKKFVSGINALVVGRSIDDLSVDVVAGSSLTGEGFNSAIEEIKGEAGA